MFEFLDFDNLTDGEIDLVIEAKHPADESRGYVPVYACRITLHGSSQTIGRIDLRIGYNENIRYGGHIGYGIDETYRGHHYAAKACRIIRQVAAAHEMERLLITCNPDNIPSRKTCESIGAVLVETVNLPLHNEQYLEGERRKCIYEWNIGNPSSEE